MTFYELFSKLKHITRYSGVNMIQPEKLESHILEMCGLAMDLHQQFGNFDLHKVIYLIVIHDLDESITVDIPRPFKYHTKEFYEAFQSNVRSYLTEKLNNSPFIDEILNAKSYGLEGKIVKLLDLVQVKRKLNMEKALGNTTLYKIDQDITNYLSQESWDGEIKDYLLFLLNQTKLYVQD